MIDQVDVPSADRDGIVSDRVFRVVAPFQLACLVIEREEGLRLREQLAHVARPKGPSHHVLGTGETSEQETIGRCDVAPGPGRAIGFGGRFELGQQASAGRIELQAFRADAHVHRARRHTEVAARGRGPDEMLLVVRAQHTR